MLSHRHPGAPLTFAANSGDCFQQSFFIFNIPLRASSRCVENKKTSAEKQRSPEFSELGYQDSNLE